MSARCAHVTMYGALRDVPWRTVTSATDRNSCTRAAASRLLDLVEEERELDDELEDVRQVRESACRWCPSSW